MWHNLIFFAFLFNIFNAANSFLPKYPKTGNVTHFKNKGAGEALYLTPLIEAGLIEEARDKASTHFSDFQDIESYSGYITVQKEYNSNLYFWFFPSQNSFEKDPLLLWLAGGPGSPSVFNAFNELGPYRTISNQEIALSETTWVKNHNVLYIDSPVGTGFSFTNNDNGYARNEMSVGNDLYTFLVQFFELFPKLQNNDFYVVGSSYAGKYVPAVSFTIHQRNRQAPMKVNLKGLAMANGWCDPLHQIGYAHYLYELGFLDKNARDEFIKYEQQVIAMLKNEQWFDALDAFNTLLLNEQPKTDATYFANKTGFGSIYNYLYPAPKPDYTYDYLQNSRVRDALHVGDNIFNNGDAVNYFLRQDIMQSVTPWISELLDNYSVLFFNGQLDIIVAYETTVHYLRQLNFSAADEYKTAVRQQWHVDDDVAGYWKGAGYLTEVLVRNAGHGVLGDQPKWALDLITKFTRKQLL